MLIRGLAFLLLFCSVASGQEPTCSSLSLTIAKAPPLAWRLSVQNNRNRVVAVRISSQNFHWKIEEADKGVWNEVLSGGVGAGVASTGAKSNTGVNARTIGRRQRLFFVDFDLRRDIPAEALNPRGKYRITFDQDVDLLSSDGSVNKCTLVAEPQVFRF